MKAVLRNDHGDEVSFDCAESILELTFEGRGAPFTCLSLPKGDAIDPDIEIEFAEWIDEGEPEGLVFSARLDLATSRVRITPDHEPEVRRILEEFNRDVTPEVLAWIRDDAIRVAEHVRRSENYDISADEIRDRRRISWADVFRPGEPFDGKGTRSGFSIVSGGYTYYLVDSYCSDPDCDCGGAEIRGYRSIEGQDPRNPELVFDVATDLEGNVLDILDSKLPEEEVLRVFEDWRAAEEDLAMILDNHYLDIKDIGDRVLEDAGDRDEDSGDDVPVEPQERSGPIGRNAPCPCGSGRKYKKCCLPKDESPLR
jgi:hypothetical protein